MRGLLGGQLVPAAFYPLLDDLCAAFNIVGETLTDSMAGVVDFMSEQYDPDDPQRVWWTSTNPQGPRTWISTNPGEFRTTPPEPPCVIKELPAAPAPRMKSRHRLELGLGSTRLMPPFIPAERRAVATAERLLARDEDAALLGLGQACRQALTSKDMPTYQAAIQDLYRQFAQDMAWTAADFSLFVLLTQIQAALNIRIGEDWSSNPAGFLKTLICTLVQDQASRGPALALLSEVASSEFNTGRQEVRRALQGGMGDMGRALMLAWQRFFVAHAIVKNLAEAGIAEQDLPVASNMPDEAAACTITGIDLRARFALRHPEAEALELAAMAGPTFGELRRQANKCASEIIPSYTRFFAEVLAAQALTVNSDPAAKRQGLVELERLRGAVELDRDFEAEWIDHARMNTLRGLGETARAKAIATSLAGKMTVRSVLGGRG